VDLSGFGKEAREDGLQQLLQEEVSQPFDLVEGPLFRMGDRQIRALTNMRCC